MKGNNYGTLNKGRVMPESEKKKHSEARKRQEGAKNPNFKHGKTFLLNTHLQKKKKECVFGCKSKFYELHHEPPLEEDIRRWEGKLINVCKSCHKKIHDGTLKAPEIAGILWTVKDTEELLK